MSTIPPYNKGMKCVCPEEIVEQFECERRRRRNEALRARLLEQKSFEDMLLELASLRGLNARERAEEGMREALPA